MKEISELLNSLGDLIVEKSGQIKEIEIDEITSDSRSVTSKKVFVAIRGNQKDGHDFLADCAKKGAALLVGEKPTQKLDAKMPYIQVKDSRKALALLADAFYDSPSSNIQMIGVTGTSGKTTTTYLLESIFQAAGKSVGVIGTVNYRFLNENYPASHTTPDPLSLQALLKKMKDQGVDTVVMEVSSHALSQDRVWGVQFDGVVFTNLSAEHLDYHADMEDYFAAKRILFTDFLNLSRLKGKTSAVAINVESDYGKRLQKDVQALGSSFKERSFSLNKSLQADLDGSLLRSDLSGIKGQIDSIEIDSSLFGDFNSENILAAVAVARAMGVSDANISKGVKSLGQVPGRLEKVIVDSPLCEVTVLVDYAHKPDALDKVLKILSEFKSRQKAPIRLLTVVGCGGDRDRTKRPVMGEMAFRYSDRVFVTSDNPRTEDPEKIISEVLEGVPEGAHNPKIEVIVDRAQAIQRAIQEAQGRDLVLIAGKGHETYQLIPDPNAPGQVRKIDFDDRLIAQDALILKKNQYSDDGGR
jgi:UDP-N-acetylmuramoyl-L-alanyl-D-glutamate--2,6-diaminopimelate ligase